MKILLAALAALPLAGCGKPKVAVQEVQKAPERYVQSLQNDQSRAKQVQVAADAAVKATDQEVQKAVDADK